MRLEIEKTNGEYTLRNSAGEQTHPTLVGLLRGIVSTFHNVTPGEAGQAENTALVETTKTLIDYLFKNKFSPSQVVDVLEQLESAVQRNLGATKSPGVQRQLLIQTEEQQTDLYGVPITIPESIFAQEFDKSSIINEHIGNFTIWNHNGSIAAATKGTEEVKYFTKYGITYLKKLRKTDKQKFIGCITMIPEGDRQTVVDLIETLIDDEMGMFSTVKTATHIEGDEGVNEIDAEQFERAGW